MDFDHFVVDVRDPISTKIEADDSPSLIRLDQNFPNPFSTTTKIGFNVPSACQVEIAIYNSQGFKIESILNEFLETGFHSVDWVPSKLLKSGIYYYQLRSEGILLSKKMLLIK